MFQCKKLLKNTVELVKHLKLMHRDDLNNTFETREILNEVASNLFLTKNYGSVLSQFCSLQCVHEFLGPSESPAESSTALAQPVVSKSVSGKI